MNDDQPQKERFRSGEAHTKTIGVPLTPSMARRLDELAIKSGLTRAAAARQLLARELEAEQTA
jgi:predicted transcriptional regulator